MTPEIFINDFNQIIAQIIALTMTAEKIAPKVDDYIPMDTNVLSTLRMDIHDNFMLLTNELRRTREWAHRLGIAINNYNQNKPLPKAGIRRFINIDGVLHEVTLEEAAEREKLSIPEYLAKEQEELANMPEE